LGTVLANAVQLGPLPASTTLHIAVALKLNNRDLLVQYVKAINDPSSPLYGSSLTVSQFVANYAPTSAQVQSVVNYLVAQGFSNIQVEPNNLFVTADGTVAEIGAALYVLLALFNSSKTAVRSTRISPTLRCRRRWGVRSRQCLDSITQAAWLHRPTSRRLLL